METKASEFDHREAQAGEIDRKETGIRALYTLLFFIIVQVLEVVLSVIVTS